MIEETTLNALRSNAGLGFFDRSGCICAFKEIDSVEAILPVVVAFAASDDFVVARPQPPPPLLARRFGARKKTSTNTNTR